MDFSSFQESLQTEMHEGAEDSNGAGFANVELDICISLAFCSPCFCPSSHQSCVFCDVSFFHLLLVFPHWYRGSFWTSQLFRIRHYWDVSIFFGKPSKIPHETGDIPIVFAVEVYQETSSTNHLPFFFLLEKYLQNSITIVKLQNYQVYRR